MSISDCVLSPAFEVVGNEKAKTLVGNEICKTAAQLVVAAVAAKKIVEITRDKGARLLTAGTTIGAGVLNVYSGNVITGATLTAVGVKEMLNMFGHQLNRSTVSSLISDTRSNVKMIQTLEEANRKSHEVIEGNLEIVSSNVKELQTRMKKIRQLSMKGSKEINLQTIKTISLYKETQALFIKAERAFKISQNKISQSNTMFGIALARFGHGVEIAQKELIAINTQEFLTEATEAYRECVNARNVLEQSGNHLNDGLEILKQAMTKHNEASFEAGRTEELAKNELEKIAKLASTQKLEQSTRKKIDLMQKELIDINHRDADKQVILNDILGDLKCVDEELSEEWSTTSIVIGGGLGAIFGTAALGTFGVFVGLPVGAKMMHERKRISSWMFGKDPEPTPIPTETNPVAIEFSSFSTGYWGRYVRKEQSYTQGKVCIDLGQGEKVTFNFNLNNKSAISKMDLYRLQCLLMGKLAQGQITPQSCLNILNRLETTIISRGGHHVDSKGLIGDKNFYFNELKRKCASLLPMDLGN